MWERLDLPLGQAHLHMQTDGTLDVVKHMLKWKRAKRLDIEVNNQTKRCKKGKACCDAHRKVVRL